MRVLMLRMAKKERENGGFFGIDEIEIFMSIRRSWIFVKTLDRPKCKNRISCPHSLPPLV